MAVQHNDPGADLTRDEFIEMGHHLVDQATGDIIYASSSTVLSRMAAPSRSSYFTMSGLGVPEYVWPVPLADLDLSALAESDLPDLSADKTTSGEFDAARIPDLDATKLTTGLLDAARIPGLAANATTFGTFDAARIPAQPFSKVSGSLADNAAIHVSTSAPTSTDGANGDFWFQRDA